MRALFVRNSKGDNKGTPNSRNTSLSVAKLKDNSYKGLRFRRSIQTKSRLNHFQNLLLRGMNIQKYLDKPIDTLHSQKNLAKIQPRSTGHKVFTTNKHNYTRVPFIPDLFPVDNLPFIKEEVKDLWNEENARKYNARVLEEMLKKRNNRMNKLYKKMYNAGLHSNSVKNELKLEINQLKKSTTESKLKGIIKSINYIGKPTLQVKGRHNVLHINTNNRNNINLSLH